MPANRVRGEVELVLGDDRFVLRPTYAAIVALEDALGGVLDLAVQASEGRLSVRTLAVAFHHCIAEDSRDRPSVDALGDRIVAAGVVHAVDTYRALLTAILTGGSDADGAR